MRLDQIPTKCMVSWFGFACLGICDNKLLVHNLYTEPCHTWVVSLRRATNEPITMGPQRIYRISNFTHENTSWWYDCMCHILCDLLSPWWWAQRAYLKQNNTSDWTAVFLLQEVLKPTPLRRAPWPCPAIPSRGGPHEPTPRLASLVGLAPGRD